MAASLGTGGAALRILRVDDGDRLEHAVVSFVLGFGILGWLVFFMGLAGVIAPVHLGALAVVLAAGLATFRKVRPLPAFRFGHRSVLLFLLVILAVTAFGDVIEGLAPPADADSLAYHFATPKLFLKEGRLFFIERAVDGASPMLLHMTYLAALGLGGETCLTLWAMVTGWSAGAIMFVAARRMMSDEAALAVAALFLTTPAVIYGAGTGQVEVRDAALVVLGVMAATRARENPRYAILAGLAAGFFAASKYTGLLFAACLGAVGCCVWRRQKQALLFVVAAASAGAQWYLWQWWESGDPVFPMLAGILPYRPGIAWDLEHHARFLLGYREAESALPRDLMGFISYPFLATFSPAPAFDSGRIGLGPLLIALVPFAACGLISRSEEGLRKRAGFMLAVGALFYVAWFCLGPSQRVRHFLPVFPLGIMAALALAHQAARGFPGLRLPAAAAAAGTLLVQAAGQVVFAANPARMVLVGEGRSEYLARNVAPYLAIEEVNQRLKPGDRVLVVNREAVYYLDVPVFYAHAQLEARIDVGSSATGVGHFVDQLNRESITHLLVPRDPLASRGIGYLVEQLLANCCATVVSEVAGNWPTSRTLGLGGIQLTLSLVERTPATCRIDPRTGPP